MFGKSNKILYWLSPIVGAALQILILSVVLFVASKQENPAEPGAVFVAGSMLFFLLTVMIILTYGYLLLIRCFPRFFWLLSCICFLIISTVVIYPVNAVYAAEKFLYFKIVLCIIEIVPFLTPAFIATYKYALKRS